MNPWEQLQARGYELIILPSDQPGLVVGYINNPQGVAIAESIPVREEVIYMAVREYAETLIRKESK